jgi:lysophospholipase L1-like esterase
MKKILAAVIVICVTGSLISCASSVENLSTTETALTTAAATTTTAEETTVKTDETVLEQETTQQANEEATEAETAETEETTEEISDDLSYWASIPDDQLLYAIATKADVNPMKPNSTGSARLRNAVSRGGLANGGEELTVAFIGGSITEGVGATADTCYAKLTYDWLVDYYEETTFHYINAGISGTPSILGAAREERDIPEADIVFIEFAVNDGQDTLHKQAYESLVRHYLALPNQPAVFLLFTVLKNGSSAQDHMKQIGEYYNLPMISLKDGLTPFFDSGRLTWEDYSDDESHPNTWGHNMVAQIIGRKIDTMVAGDAGIADVIALPSEPLFGDEYENMHFRDRLNTDGLTNLNAGSFAEKDGRAPTFPNGWEYREGDEPFSFDFTGDALMLVSYTNNNSDYGAVDVYVDGEFSMTVNSHLSNGWGNPYALPGFVGAYGEHHVEIRPQEGCKFFSLLGISYGD